MRFIWCSMATPIPEDVRCDLTGTDGSRILLMCENQGLLPDPPPDYNEDLCVMAADGSDLVNITNTPEVFENWPSWGPAPRHGDDDEGDDDDRNHDERDDD